MLMSCLGNRERYGDEKPVAFVVVVESKGKHLMGSEDTTYKRSIAGYFGKVGRKISWQKLGKDFEDETFRFQALDEGEYEDRDWREDLKQVLEEPLRWGKTG